MNQAAEQNGPSGKDAEGQAPAQQAGERLERLQRLAVALSAALTVEQVADAIITEGLAALGGNSGSIALLAEEDSEAGDAPEFVTLRCLGYSPALVAAYARYPYDTSLPNADVVRSGEPLFLDTLAERNARYPHLAGNRPPGGRGALAALPLVADGRAFGGLALSFPTDRMFSPADRAFMQTIGQTCAQALERGRLYDSARREVVERRQAEEALRESEALKGAILEAALDSIITIDEAERVVEWNPAAERTFGYTRAQALGRRLSHLIIPLTLREEHARGLAHYLATGEGPVLNRRIEVSALRADGTEFPVELTAVPIRLGGRTLFTATLRDLSEREQAAAQQRVFLKDVLRSVTEGKLHLCDLPGELPAPLPSQDDWIPLSLSSGLRELRMAAQAAAIAEGFADERWMDLVAAVGEAGMNAVVHAGGGRGQVCGSEDKIQVWIEDSGQGINVADLPRAALEKGYTTAGTLGQGMKMMLQTADRLWLRTGPEGTTVVLEQERLAPLPEWLRMDPA